MFYIYILYSEGYDMYYVGHSNDPERRLTEHNTTEEIKFTTKFRPWELVLSFEVSQSRGEAIKVEKFIKSQKSKQFIKCLIRSKDNPEFIRGIIKKAVG
jgi:putative endonuclease